MTNQIKDNDVATFIDETFGPLEVRKRTLKSYRQTGAAVYDSFYQWAFENGRKGMNEAFAYGSMLELIDNFTSHLLYGYCFNDYRLELYREQTQLEIEREIGHFKAPAYKKAVEKALEKIASLNHQFVAKQVSLFLSALHVVCNDYFSTILDSMEKKYE